MMKTARQIMPHLAEEPKVCSLYCPFPAKQQTSRSPSASGMYCPHVDVSLPYAASSDITSTIPLTGPLSASTYPHSPSSPNAIIPTDTEAKLRPRVQIVPQHTPSFQKPDTPQDPHPTRSRRKYKLVNWSVLSQVQRKPIRVSRPLPPPVPRQAKKERNTTAKSLTKSWVMAVVNGPVVQNDEDEQRGSSASANVLAGHRLIPHHASSTHIIPTLVATATGYPASMDCHVPKPGVAMVRRTAVNRSYRATSGNSLQTPAPRTMCSTDNMNPSTARVVNMEAPISSPSFHSPSIKRTVSSSSTGTVNRKESTKVSCSLQAELWSSVVKRVSRQRGTAVLLKTTSSSSSAKSKPSSKSSLPRDYRTTRHLKQVSVPAWSAQKTSRCKMSDGTSTPLPTTHMNPYRASHLPPNPTPPSPPLLNLTPPAIAEAKKTSRRNGRDVADFAANRRQPSCTSIGGNSGSYSTSASEVSVCGYDDVGNKLSLKSSPVPPTAVSHEWARSSIEADDDRPETQSSSELYSTGDEENTSAQRDLSNGLPNERCYENSSSSSWKNSYCSCCNPQDRHCSCSPLRSSDISTTDKNGSCDPTSMQGNVGDVSERRSIKCEDQVGVVQLVCGVSMGEAISALEAADGDMIAAFEVASSKRDYDSGGLLAETGARRDTIGLEMKSSKWELVRRRKKANRQGRK